MRAMAERCCNRIWYGVRRPPLAWRLLALAHGAVVGQRALRPAQRPSVPLIVVGNLGVGGGGKTPVVIALARYLRGLGHAVGVVSRGYGGRQRGPCPVGPDDDPADYGDEPVLIAGAAEVPVWIARHRARAVAAATAVGITVVISDDGLQHRALARSFEICVVDGQRGFGNGLLLPAGPLRQPLTRLDQVDAVLVKGPRLPELSLPSVALDVELRPSALRRLDDAARAAEPIEDWQGREVDAVCGIANPASFVDTLSRLGLKPRLTAFPDHHRYTARQIERLPGPVVVTAKDAVKLRRLQLSAPAWVLETEAVLPESLLAAVAAHVREYST